MINWTYSNVEQVAELLFRVNPSVRAGFKTPEALTQWIKNHCNSQMTAPGYVATYGFCVTLYTIDGDTSGQLHAKATVEPYGVDKFITEMLLAECAR